MKPDVFLKKHGLRITPCREDVITFFSHKKHSVSHADVEGSLGKKYDRVTLYRTLSSFLESGIIHKVPDDSGTAHFAMCAEECSQHVHYDNHVHFKCNQCNQSKCLNEILVPTLSLPKGYKASSSSLLIEGICSSCNK